MTIRKAPRVRDIVCRSSLSLGLVVALVLSAAGAGAEDAKVEASAKALQKKAMDEDYLATDFAKGLEKLDRAIAACGTDKCGPALRAQLRRDMGVLEIGGQVDREKGVKDLVEALKIDPAIALEPDLRTKDLDSAFAEAKKRAGAASGPATKPPSVEPKGGQPSGDFGHEPASEQQVRTPIPIYATYAGEETLVKVIARYKGFGMNSWKTLELTKSGDKGWGGLLPCADVQQGVTQYYLQGFNAANDPVAVGGDRNHAYKVKVTTDKVASAPHLPDQEPPSQCADTGDCPPNFPGCKTASAAELTGKDGGEFCEDDTECKSKECKASKCTEPKRESRGSKLWVGLSFGLDVHFAPSAGDVCKLSPPNAPQNPLTPLNGNNYYCIASDGSDYPYRPISAADAASNPRGKENTNLVQDGKTDKVTGGAALGNVRVMVSADYALSSNFLLGARLGYVLRTYPGEAAKDDGKGFPPLHAELRGTFLIGNDAINQSLVPYVMVGGGVAPFEAPIKVSLVEQATPTAAKIQKDVDAWHIAGPGFVTAGGGVRVGLSPRAALMAGLRANYAFGRESALSLGPDVGIAFGL